MTDIYHITHITNLAGIIQAGGLRCDSHMHQQRQNYQRIGYQDIKTRRMRRNVPIAPHGVLADYVPLYFGPRSPMLLTINSGNVPGYSGGQNPIMHLVVEIEQLAQQFVFTDRHAALRLAKFYGDLIELNQIDWPLMNQRKWNNTDDDPDRIERRMAEFLIHQFLPWTAIKKIGVRLQGTQQEVNAIINSTNPVHKPAVEVERSWYYN